METSIVEDWIKSYGILGRLVPHDDAQFAGNTLDAIYVGSGTNVLTTTAYRPEKNQTNWEVQTKHTHQIRRYISVNHDD